MKLCNILFAALLIATTLSCSKDDSESDFIPEVTLADFAGNWIATSAVYTKKSNTSESIDFIAEGGHIRYTAFDDGRVRTWVDFQQVPVDEWDAKAEMKGGDKLVFTPAESSREPYTLTYEVEDNKITFRNADDSFDFSLIGNEPTPATSVMVFVPR